MESEKETAKEPYPVIIGRTIWHDTDPVPVSFPDGYSVINLMKHEDVYGCLSPFSLTMPEGEITENVWQFSKVYSQVKSIRQKRKDVVIWEYGDETHVDETGALMPAYMTWRKTGMTHPHAVRYPVGRALASTCLYALKDPIPGAVPDEASKLGYVEARKTIYEPMYTEAAMRQPVFHELATSLKSGTKLAIVETDGPHAESLEHYKTTWDLGDDFIVDGYMEATEANLNIMLEDTKHPYGHGYCLARALMKSME